MIAATPIATSRGLALILGHCASLGSSERRPSAVLRLRQLIGDELALLLLKALVGDHHAELRAV